MCLRTSRLKLMLTFTLFFLWAEPIRNGLSKRSSLIRICVKKRERRNLKGRDWMNKISIFSKLERFEEKIIIFLPFFSFPPKQIRFIFLSFLFSSFPFPSFPFLSFIFSPKLLSKHSVRDAVLIVMKFCKEIFYD